MKKTVMNSLMAGILLAGMSAGSLLAVNYKIVQVPNAAQRHP